EHDAAPLRKPTELEMQDAILTTVVKIASARRPYQVRGKRSTPRIDETGYSEDGIASWYGRKFHTYPTSYGEVYDMFAMTAAHKTLTLPRFARVKNLDNRKSVIFRVNARGPFNDYLSIDLDYSTAYNLL
ncbi:septal ring lytic transglycosylase RlpA family protein, partial [Pseudoalteromonas sp. S1649]|uniref:septal ring lytic transglycosylase RlpA family protein n=1 Tax=Pseudoalteromonas sp. S1649 TaxID=579508 RepID=UPI00110A9F71